MTDLIEGFVVGGTTQLTVANTGRAVEVALNNRGMGRIDTVLSVEQSKRLRRMLAAAEKRASETTQ